MIRRISPNQNNWKKTVEIDRYVTEAAEDKRENVPDEYFVGGIHSQVSPSKISI